jgi:hypothetical protein
MAVSFASGMTVNIDPGNAAVPSANSSGSTLCVSDAQEQVALPAAPASGSNRYDLIIIRPRGTDLDGGVNNDFIFDYVTGDEAASPAVPATPAGTLALATIYETGGSAAITPANVIDARPSGLAFNAPFSPVHFKAIQSPGQSIPSRVWTVITTWAAPEENIGGGSFSNGRYFFPEDGLYWISTMILWANPAGTYSYQAQLAFEGSVSPGVGGQSWATPNAAGNTGSPPNSVIRQVKKGAAVLLQGYNGATAAVNTFAGYGWFVVHRIG